MANNRWDNEDPYQERLKKKIQDALDGVKGALDRRKEGIFTGQLTEYQGNTVLRHEIEWLITVVEWEMAKWYYKHDDAEEREDIVDYLDGVELGSMWLPNGQPKVFNGVHSIIEADDPIVVEKPTTRETQFGSENDVETVQVQIDYKILFEAYRAVQQWIVKAGFGLDLSDGRKDRFHIARKDREDYGEPVKEDIPKPR